MKIAKSQPNSLSFKPTTTTIQSRWRSLGSVVRVIGVAILRLHDRRQLAEWGKKLDESLADLNLAKDFEAQFSQSFEKGVETGTRTLCSADPLSLDANLAPAKIENTIPAREKGTPDA